MKKLHFTCNGSLFQQITCVLQDLVIINGCAGIDTKRDGVIGNACSATSILTNAVSTDGVDGVGGEKGLSTASHGGSNNTRLAQVPDRVFTENLFLIPGTW